MEPAHTLVQQSVSTLRQPLRPVTTPERHAVLTSVAERVLALGPGRLRVGIDGLTAAGKTSFGHQLADRVSHAGRPVARACLDDVKRPWRDRHLYDRESGEGYYRNAYDYTAAINLLLEPSDPLGSGECTLCSIDPLTQVDHSSVRTQLAPIVSVGILAGNPQCWAGPPGAARDERCSHGPARPDC